MPQADFARRLDLLPKSPGVYLMKDEKGEVIYIGKASVLPQRLRAYFTPHPQGNRKVLSMISKISDFETITTENELEALILENNLIKSYQPRYNILLRDDKEYPYIRITLQEAYPRVLKAFRPGPDQNEGARYFGPYLSWDLKEALDALYRIFPLKTCTRVFPRDIGKERPCLNYYIGRCIGPCLGTVKEEDYRQLIHQVVRFLEGQYNELLIELKNEMKEAAKKLEFEKAAELRDRHRALERLMQKQNISFCRDEDLDVLGLAQSASDTCLLLMRLRQGRIVQAGAQFVQEQELPVEEIVESFLTQHYHPSQDLPRLILLPEELPKKQEQMLEDYLQQMAGYKIELRHPKRGEKRALLDMAMRNAEESLRRHTLMGRSQGSRTEALEVLANFLNLPVPPERLEAFDVANIGEETRTASMVVFERGQPSRKAYRHFSVQSFSGIDDYRAMTEVVLRRIKRLEDPAFGRRPNLLLIDGGLGHVNAVQSLLTERGCDIPVAGMVKNERHKTRGIVRADGTIYELLEGATDENPSLRAERLGLLRLITAIQNEAHRFANRLLQKQKKKQTFKFSLEDIEGVGPARRQALLKHFPSVKAISEASLSDLKKIAGIPENVAEAVYLHFHPEGVQEESQRRE